MFPVLFPHRSQTQLYSCRVVAPRTIITSSKGLVYPRLGESSLVTDLVNGSRIAFQGPEGRIISRWTLVSIRGRMTTALPSVEVGLGLKRMIVKSALESRGGANCGSGIDL